MINKNQVIVFVICFLIAGFFVFATANEGFSQPPTGCCVFEDFQCDVLTAEQCETAEGSFQGVGSSCDIAACNPPQIPTLNEWGTIIMAGMLGLFAVIGIFAMRRRSAVIS